MLFYLCTALHLWPTENAFLCKSCWSSSVAGWCMRNRDICWHSCSFISTRAQHDLQRARLLPKMVLGLVSTIASWVGFRGFASKLAAIVASPVVKPPHRVHRLHKPSRPWSAKEAALAADLITTSKFVLVEILAPAAKDIKSPQTLRYPHFCSM